MRNANRKTWKVVLACAALCATILQITAILVYSPLPEGAARGPERVASTTAGSTSSKTSDVDRTVVDRTVSNTIVTKSDPSSVERRDPKGILSKSNFSTEKALEKNDSEASDSQKSDLKDLIRLASVEINHQATATQGAGVVVSSSREGFEVLTACHVVKGKDDLKVVAFRQFGSELERCEYRSVSVLSCDEDSDLAKIFVETSESPAPIARFAPESIKKSRKIPEGGLAVWGLGWTEGGRPVPKSSKITTRRSAQREMGRRAVGYWVIDSPSAPGMSGGPLLDLNGYLVGIASGNSGGNAYYLDEFEISRYIHEARSNETTDDPK